MSSAKSRPSGAFFWRYFIPLALFVVGGVTMPLVFVIPSQRSFLHERARAETIGTAELAGRVFASALATGKVVDLKNEMNAMRRAYPAFSSMAVATRAGKIIAHTDPSQEGKLEVDLFPPPVSTVVRSMRSKDGATHLEVTLPIANGEEVRGTLRAEMRVEAPATPPWTGFQYLGALTVVLLGLGCLVSLHLARSAGTGKVVVRERIVPERTDERPAGPVQTASPVNELLAAVCDATPAGLFVVDEVTRKILHANGAFCRLWGLEESQSQLRAGSADYDAIAAHCNGAARAIVLPTGLGTADIDPLRLVDEELRCNDGRTVHCFSLPLTMSGRHVRLYVHTDVTAERQREQELTQSASDARTALQEKAAFNARIARTLRAPLSGMLNTLNVLAETTLTAQQSTYVDTVRSSADDVLGMVSNLIDLAAMEANELHLASNDVTLRDLVHEALEPFAALAHRKSIDLAGVIADNLPNGFSADALRLRQILSNLIGSAIQATEHGEVVVHVSAPPAEMSVSAAGIRFATDNGRGRSAVTRQSSTRSALRFEVRYTGRGLTPDEQACLFQVKGAQSTDAQYRTHLPLLVAKQLVDLMDGRIGVENDPTGGNTLWFAVTLQINANVKSEVTPSADTFNASRILVVDDNATVRELLVQQLRGWHITAESAPGGEEALRLLKTAVDRGTPYTAAIIDAHMPDMDGLTLVEAVRHEVKLGEMTLFLLTATPQLSGDTYPGVAATLSKPVSSPALYAMLTTHLGVKTGERRTVSMRAAARSKGQPRGRLLLAEDNLVNQKIALRMLDKLGYQTDVVVNGSEAVEAAAKTQYDAILMDCQMPEMDGVTAASLIRRAEGRERHVPIIAVTANSTDSDRERCLAAGMDDFLPKPVRAADIEAVLLRWTAVVEPSGGFEGTLRLAPSAAQSA